LGEGVCRYDQGVKGEKNVRDGKGVVRGGVKEIVKMRERGSYVGVVREGLNESIGRWQWREAFGVGEERERVICKVRGSSPLP